MTPTRQPELPPGESLPASTPPASPAAPSDEARLRDALKRCSPDTIEAACAFRQNSDFTLLPVIVRGVIARYTGREHRDRLSHANSSELHLTTDLGLDSLTMMEIVMLTEDVFPITIANDELRGLRTVGDVQHYIAAKLRGEPLPVAPACDCPRSASLVSAAGAGNASTPMPAHPAVHP